jgi:hypothetical protein
LLLKNPWNLSDDQRERLSTLVRWNAPIMRAYYPKEAFQMFWDYKQPKRAEDHLEKWMRWRLEPFKKFVRMLRSHLDGILAWTKHRISITAAPACRCPSNANYTFWTGAIILSTTEKSAETVPIPSESVARAATVKPGLRRSARAADRSRTGCITRILAQSWDPTAPRGEPEYSRPPAPPTPEKPR